MQLEEYFDFQRPDDIRLRGSRIGIETILYEYIYRARTPEQIVQTYTSLTLDQVYATILYYIHNKETVSKYMADWLEHGHKAREEQRRNPSPGVARLMKIKAAREALKMAHGSQLLV